VTHDQAVQALVEHFDATVAAEYPPPSVEDCTRPLTDADLGHFTCKSCHGVDTHDPNYLVYCCPYCLVSPDEAVKHGHLPDCPNEVLRRPTMFAPTACISSRPARSNPRPSTTSRTSGSR
jgi:hypothetical protein